MDRDDGGRGANPRNHGGQREVEAVQLVQPHLTPQPTGCVGCEQGTHAAWERCDRPGMSR